MPRFYFDTDDGRTSMRDVYGIELADKYAARDLAVLTLPDMAQDAPASADQQRMAVYVRNESDQPVIVVTLDLEVKWT